MSLPPRVNYMQKKPATLTLHTSIPAERCIRLQPRTPQASLEPRFLARQVVKGASFHVQHELRGESCMKTHLHA